MSNLSQYPGSDIEQCKIECIDTLINSKEIVSNSISTTSNYSGSKHDVVYIYAVLEKCLAEINKITNICAEYQDTSIIAKYGIRFKKNVEVLKSSEPGFTEAFSCMCALSKWIDNAQNYIINDFEGADDCLISSISHQWQDIFFCDTENSLEFNKFETMDAADIAGLEYVDDYEQPWENAELLDETDELILDEEIDDDFDFDAEFSESDSILDSNNVVELLANELKGISSELDDLVITIVYGEDEQLLTAVTDYITQVECLMEACEAVELSGLSTVCSFIIENITILSSQSKQQRECLLDLVQPWIKLVMTYLSEPVTDQTCLNIVNHLDNQSWPAPLSGAAWRDIFTKLYNDISNTLESDEENQRQTTVTIDDVDLTIAADARPEVVDAFMQEAPQLATEFSTHLESIRLNNDVTLNLEAAQRVSHSLKGSANLIGLKGIANLAHNLEDIFELLLKKQILILPDGLSQILEESADCIESMIDAVLGVDDVPDNALTVLQSILNWANKIEQNESLDRLTDNDSDNEASSESVVKNKLPIVQQSKNTTTNDSVVKTESIRVSTLTIDDMHRLIGEVSISVGQIQTQVRQMLQHSDHYRQQDIMVQQRRFDLENIIDLRGKDSVQHPISENTKNTDFDALEMDQYDDLYSTTHRYIEAVADSREISQAVYSELVKLDGLFLQQSRLNKELENIVIATRMVPISSIESRLYRNIRQVCRATNKKASLEIDGLDLMLDVEVLNKLVNPLMHILRNSVDHGIEHEDERVFEQKNSEGKINLKFSHDGNHVLVVCFDDGRGLDYFKIRESAINKGILRRDHQADNTELARLILTPGFTTRETTTQISGRGIGLDVVHNTIKELKGTLELGDSESGGLQITIRLPVSLVTSHSLVICSNNKLMALPTNALTQVLAPGTGQFKRLGDAMTFQLGKNIYPVKTIASLLNQQQTEIDQSKTIILIRSDTGIIAVTIDSAVNSVDLVIKSAGSYVGNISGVLGVSILGDGSIIPVLDVLELLRNPVTQSNTQVIKSHTTITQPDLIRVLIVDDSLSVRKSLTQLVEDAGFEPIQASDGVEAMTILENETPDIALIDMEMPRMNGLELTQYIRGSDTMRNLPIIMITSRAQQKHREHAKSVGVNSYVTKPYTEDKLLDEINILISS